MQELSGVSKFGYVNMTLKGKKIFRSLPQLLEAAGTRDIKFL